MQQVGKESMAKRVLALAAIVLIMAMAVQPSEAAPEDAALRFPGRGGSSRPRNPVFPGYPRARPSPPASSGGFPSPPTPRLAPPPPPPCARSPTIEPPVGFPVVPGFPGLPGGSTPSSSPTECVTPLAGLMTCGTFLTGSDSETPTPQSECCAGLQGFINSTGAAGDGDRTLRCLCPVILGDVNKMLPKPVDPVRMMYLPIACGVVLPPQVLFMCFTGHPTPTVVNKFSQLWETPSSVSSP